MYGFVANPANSRWHNLAIRLTTLPLHLLQNRPSNLACHNLCSFRTPPPNYRALLGLGLNFCLQPKFTSGPEEFQKCSTRFRRDIYTQMFFAHADDEDYDPTQLFLRSDWEPPPDQIPAEFRARVSHFLRTIQPQFKKRRAISNIPRHHLHLLQKFRADKLFSIIPSDKNLGPCILEYEAYIKRVFLDHLLDATTYEQLQEDEAKAAVDSTYNQIEDFIITHGKDIDYADRIYIDRSTQVEDPFAYFYITAKVHKTPWKTRPIVSVAGSVTHGLGRWLDQQLQPLCRQLPSYLKSSFELKKQLDNLPLDLPRMSFFTADATSMYTNIDTDHALAKIAAFLRTSPLATAASSEPLIRALEIIMRRNYFRFGDTYWLQTTGTAMGTPPGCVYATLYFGIWELEIVPYYSANLPFYRRYIDDVFGIWLHDPDPIVDQQKWMAFQSSMNSYGKLEWEFSERTNRTHFLDLDLQFTPAGIKTKLFEKTMNLYLYLPPHSAHPPGVLRGLIIGMIKRIFKLTTDFSDKEASVLTFFGRLIARGYPASLIRPIFEDAVLRESIKRRPPTEPAPYEKRVFLHLPFNPKDAPSSFFQRTFRSTLLQPSGEPSLPTMLSAAGDPIRTNRMVVAYHRPHNLKNLLFPRRFDPRFDCPPSSILADLKALDE
jgi:hypothetical protein